MDGWCPAVTAASSSRGPRQTSDSGNVCGVAQLQAGSCVVGRLFGGRTGAAGAEGAFWQVGP